MSRILLLYATIDGHCARIAEHMARRLRAASHTVTLRSVDAVEAAWEIATHDAVLVGGSIRYGHHAPALVKLARERRKELESRPSAFFSVCLSAGGPGARPKAVLRYREEFFRRSGWHPELATSFAGALLYTRYKRSIRWTIRFIMTLTGGDTDTSRDYEYTDWEAVDRFADEFARGLPATAHAPVPNALAAGFGR